MTPTRKVTAATLGAAVAQILALKFPSVFGDIEFPLTIVATFLAGYCVKDREQEEPAPAHATKEP